MPSQQSASSTLPTSRRLAAILSAHTHLLPLDCVSVQVATKPKKKRSAREGAEGEGRKRPRQAREGGAKSRKKRPGDPGYDPYDFTSSESEGEGEGPDPPAPKTQHEEEEEEAMETGPAHISEERSVLRILMLLHEMALKYYCTGCLHSVPKWAWHSPLSMPRACQYPDSLSSLTRVIMTTPSRPMRLQLA